MAEARELDDDEWCTQYGTDEAPFRNRPRSQPAETDISLIAGRLSGDEAAQVVRKIPTAGRYNHVARHTTVGAIRTAGFVVLHTPGKRNPNHVSVTFEGDWTDEVSKMFDDCFDSSGEADV